MHVPPLSIDVRGEWSPRQAQKIIEALREEAAERGLGLKTIDISTWNRNRLLIRVFCRAHKASIAIDAKCPMCIQLAEVNHD